MIFSRNQEMMQLDMQRQQMRTNAVESADSFGQQNMEAATQHHVHRAREAATQAQLIQKYNNQMAKAKQTSIRKLRIFTTTL
jgi:hypothetical protein